MCTRTARCRQKQKAPKSRDRDKNDNDNTTKAKEPRKRPINNENKTKINHITHSTTQPPPKRPQPAAPRSQVAPIRIFIRRLSGARGRGRSQSKRPQSKRRRRQRQAPSDNTGQIERQQNQHTIQQHTAHCQCVHCRLTRHNAESEVRERAGGRESRRGGTSSVPRKDGLGCRGMTMRTHVNMNGRNNCGNRNGIASRSYESPNIYRIRFDALALGRRRS